MNSAYQIDLAVPYGKLRKVIEWCTIQCRSAWGFDTMISTKSMNEDTLHDLCFGTTVYQFCFESEQDYVAFLLWKDSFFAV